LESGGEWGLLWVMSGPISSPCRKTCAVDGRTGLCIGCGRTLPEIAAWGRLSEAERLSIIAALPARLANSDEAASSCAP
jgi:predicted Fe-S protein YdhL (DUF1289 family)